MALRARHFLAATVLLGATSALALPPGLEKKVDSDFTVTSGFSWRFPGFPWHPPGPRVPKGPAVPEPTAAVLFAGGLAVAALRLRRRAD